MYDVFCIISLDGWWVWRSVGVNAQEDAQWGGAEVFAECGVTAARFVAH